jgi:beta-aspartyl-peptidase (threonine type)
MQTMTLVVQGGAGILRPGMEEPSREGIARALEAGWAVLESGGSSLDACERAILLLEDDPAFDAGNGAYLHRDGGIQLDAILMDGSSLKSGAVGAVERIRNPIVLARRILEKCEHSFLVGGGAEQFALEQGLELCNPNDLITPREHQRWIEKSSAALSQGTVGAVAMDAAGRLCAGTSTGGTFFKHPGRIGDTPLIGCGCYADNQTAAVSCTGHGESIMKVVLAKTAADFVAGGLDAQAAADASIKLLAQRTAANAGLILIDASGRAGVSFSTPHMTWAARTTVALL